jgi:hypothetical protein
MRARSIKPGICDNEVLGTADPFYTLLFERLWMIADREGRLEDRPLRIKAQAFPYRDGLDVEPMLAWLANEGFIVRYEIEGKRYIQVLEFKKHQKPHANEQDSVIPPPGKEESTTKVVPPPNQGGAMDALNPSSLNPESGPPDSGSLGIAPTAPAGKQPTPEGAMAIALRDLGVTVTSIDPVLIAWVKDGYTPQQGVDAVGIARIRKPHPEPIHPNYLDKILRQPARASPPKSAADRITWRPPPDESETGCTPPNTTRSSKH